MGEWNIWSGYWIINTACRSSLATLKYIRNISTEMSKYVLVLGIPELYNQAKFILLLLYDFRAKRGDSQQHTNLRSTNYSVSCPWLCGLERGMVI
jgi:hypothetical protein